eukprot:2391791-Prymnesium_polylepis.1
MEVLVELEASRRALRLADGLARYVLLLLEEAARAQPKRVEHRRIRTEGCRNRGYDNRGTGPSRWIRTEGYDRRDKTRGDPNAGFDPTTALNQGAFHRSAQLAAAAHHVSRFESQPGP